MDMFAEIKNDYIWGPLVEGGSGDPQEGEILAGISIDGWRPNRDDGEVIANVLLTKNGDVVVDFHDNGSRMNQPVLKAIEEAKSQLQKLWNDTNKKTNDSISPSKIKAAEGVLIDNGIDPDEAQNVLQAIGYVLLDTELYPEEEST